MERQTTLMKKEAVRPDWWIVDGTDQIVGRLAAELAPILMGKTKPIYTPHVDCGDCVVVTHCEKVCFTGNKWTDKIYRYHTKHIGGLKEKFADEVRDEHPDRIIRKAVERMLPKTKLGRKMLDKLKVYAGAEHPHAAQDPKELKIDVRRK